MQKSSLLDLTCITKLEALLVGMKDCEELLGEYKTLCMDLTERNISHAFSVHLTIMQKLVECYKKYIYTHNMKPIQDAHEELDETMGIWIQDMVEIWKD